MWCLKPLQLKENFDNLSDVPHLFSLGLLQAAIMGKSSRASQLNGVIFHHWLVQVEYSVQWKDLQALLSVVYSMCYIRMWHTGRKHRSILPRAMKNSAHMADVFMACLITFICLMTLFLPSTLNTGWRSCRKPLFPQRDGCLSIASSEANTALLTFCKIHRQITRVYQCWFPHKPSIMQQLCGTKILWHSNSRWHEYC